MLAREHTGYAYDHEAPTAGGPHYLVTEAIEGAKFAGGEEKNVRSTSDSYSGQEGLGWKLRQPTSTTSAPNGLDLTHTTLYSPTTGAETETRMPAAAAGEVTEYALPSGAKPIGIAQGAEGDMWFTEQEASKIGKITPSGTTSEYALPSGSWPEGITLGSEGDLWFTDQNSSKIGKITPAGTITEYGLPSGSSPRAITLGAEGDLWFAEYGKIGKITPQGAITQYPLPATPSVTAVALGAEGDLWFTVGTQEPDFASKIGKITPEGSISEYALPATTYPNGITRGGEGNLWFTEEDPDKIGEITPSGSISEYPVPAKSQPVDMTLGPEDELWFTEDEVSKIGKISPSATGKGNQGAHDSQVIYYSAATEASVAACQDHPEWANLPCETRPAEQPGVKGLPELAVTTYTYNLYDEPLVTTSTNSEGTRTETDEYDEAGRLTAKHTTSSTGGAMPKVSYRYSELTGALIEQSSTSEGEEQKISSTYNTWGELTSYTDASGTTSTYEYDEYGRLVRADEGMGTQEYSYDPNTGELTKLVDSAAGTFTATYGVEGELASETYPDGLTACYTYNTVGEAITQKYRKSKNCESGAIWFEDHVVPTIHGEWAAQESTLGKESYSYDEDGRLVEVQETPTGKGCTTRLYSYDADGDRTALTTREPVAGTGACATEGGSTETHVYDTANRLVEPGIEYNAFGDITKLPGSDAGGSPLESHFYADGQLQEQSQAGQTLAYTLDPDHRTSEIIATGEGSGITTGITTEHYSSEGSSPSWVSELDGKWKRYIPGIGSSIVAVQQNGEAPVVQLEDLQGNIIATAAINESAPELLSSERSTEYGVPTTSKPKAFSWLGGDMLRTELVSGVVAMGARSYVPQIGRFLQPDPIPGGSANAYAYTDGNPVNETDPSGAYHVNNDSGGLSAVGEGTGEEGAATGVAAGAITPPPVNTQIEDEAWADPPWDQATAGDAEAAGSGYAGGLGRGQIVDGMISYSGNGCPKLLKDGHCPDYKDSFKEAWDWVKENAKKIVAVAAAGLTTAVIAGVTVVATTGCAAASDGDPEALYDCYKIGSIWWSLTVAGTAATISAWKLKRDE